MVSKEFKASINDLVKKRTRVTDEIKSEACRYAWKKRLEDGLEYYTNTKEEVDLMLECVEYIKNNRYSYHRAKIMAPRNVEANLKNIKKWNLNPENEEVDYYIVQEYFPTESYVKEIKKRILDECEKKLMMYGYGKKIKEIIPSFFRILNFDEYRQKLKEKGYNKNKIDMIIYRLLGMHKANKRRQ